ncbi:MAG: CoA-binding protein [Pseudomonadales bacterium]|nr:CoA-binding protein [Pseudomonadales bacterium]
MNIEKYQDPAVIRRALASRSIAIVGLSSNELRPSNFVGYYLKRHRYQIIPVNPREQRILDEPCYPSLLDIPGTVDVVDVFRDPAAVPEIAEQAVQIGAKFLWLQFGVISERGIRIAESAGLGVIVDRCIKIEHARYLGRMHWLGFNTGQISARRSPLTRTQPKTDS